MPSTKFPAEVLDQFKRLVDVSTACRAHVAVLTSLADDYPDDIKEFSRRAALPDMSVRLLGRSELEGVPHWTLGGPALLRQLLPETLPNRRQTGKKKARGKKAPVYEVYLR